MLGLSLWEGRLPGQKTIENEDKAAMGSYRPESNFGTSDTVLPRGERSDPLLLNLVGRLPSAGVEHHLAVLLERLPLEEQTV